MADRKCIQDGGIQSQRAGGWGGFMCKTGLSFSFAHTHTNKQNCTNCRWFCVNQEKLQVTCSFQSITETGIFVKEHELSEIPLLTSLNEMHEGKKICTMAWKEGSSDNLPPSLSLFLPNKLSFFLSYCLWCTCRPVSPRVHVCVSSRKQWSLIGEVSVTPEGRCLLIEFARWRRVL